VVVFARGCKSGVSRRSHPEPQRDFLFYSRRIPPFFSFFFSDCSTVSNAAAALCESFSFLIGSTFLLVHVVHSSSFCSLLLLFANLTFPLSRCDVVSPILSPLGRRGSSFSFSGLRGVTPRFVFYRRSGHEAFFPSTFFLDPPPYSTAFAWRPVR